MRSGQSTPSDLSSAASLADGESGSCSGDDASPRPRAGALVVASASTGGALVAPGFDPRRARPAPPGRPPHGAGPGEDDLSWISAERAGSSRGAPRGPAAAPAGLGGRRGAPPPPGLAPSSLALLTAPAAAAQLCGAFRRLAEPAALLASRAAVCDLVALLLDPRLLASSVYATLEGRCALRRALAALRAAGAAPPCARPTSRPLATAPRRPAPAPPDLSAAYADPANATLMLDRCHGLLLAGTSEVALCPPGCAALPWASAKRASRPRPAGPAGRARGSSGLTGARGRGGSWWTLGRRWRDVAGARPRPPLPRPPPPRPRPLPQLLRIQHTPSRLEAAVLRDLVEMHLEAGRGGEAGRGLAERLYYFPGEVGAPPRTPSTPPTFSASSVRPAPAPPRPAHSHASPSHSRTPPAAAAVGGAGAELGHGRACGKRRRLEHGIC
eukprot:tig00021719_g23146.t1